MGEKFRELTGREEGAHLLLCLERMAGMQLGCACCWGGALRSVWANISNRTIAGPKRHGGHLAWLSPVPHEAVHCRCDLRPYSPRSTSMTLCLYVAAQTSAYIVQRQHLPGNLSTISFAIPSSKHTAARTAQKAYHHRSRPS